MSDLLRGTLDMLVLRTLASGSMHGWRICERLRDTTDGVFDIGQGSVYPALQRLKLRGLVKAAWQTSELGRRARYYELTGAGRRALDDEIARWRRSVGAVEKVLEPVPEGE
ncbi:MAG: PadR family transcriptional regulator [Acidobacteria bacterium]|nr:PadR family transcriptional regulator [Acidobacteriota bacterium]